MQTVFLVEDSPLVLARLRGLLEGAAQVVGEADTAAAATAGITEAQPDIVLLDLSLADGSTGFDVLRSLGARMPRVAFYMLSNHAADPYRQLAERLGARAFLDKSKDFDRVRDLVKGKRPCLQSSC